jgi:hypothetical protein
LRPYDATEGLRGTEPPCTVITCISSDATRNKIYGLRVGISTVFKIFGHFLFKGYGTTLYGHDLQCHLMLLDTKNKNIYCLGVENSTLLMIYKNISFIVPSPDHQGQTCV